jgi:hypothetical protein
MNTGLMRNYSNSGTLPVDLQFCESKIKIFEHFLGILARTQYKELMRGRFFLGMRSISNSIEYYALFSQKQKDRILYPI